MCDCCKGKIYYLLTYLLNYLHTHTAASLVDFISFNLCCEKKNTVEYIQSMNLQEILEQTLVSTSKWLKLGGSMVPPATSLIRCASRNHTFFLEASFL
jgi:Tfp pilus assembly pilus retraction ATPase PilT